MDDTQALLERLRRFVAAAKMSIRSDCLYDIGGDRLNLSDIEALTRERDALAEALRSARDYVSDASQGMLTYKDSGEGFLAMAKEDLARIDLALTPADEREIG